MRAPAVREPGGPRGRRAQGHGRLRAARHAASGLRGHAQAARQAQGTRGSSLDETMWYKYLL